MLFTNLKDLRQSFVVSTQPGATPNEFVLWISAVPSNTTRIGLRLDDLPSAAVVWDGSNDVTKGASALVGTTLKIVLPVGADVSSTPTITLTGYDAGGFSTGTQSQVLDLKYDYTQTIDNSLTFSSDKQNMWGEFNGYLGWHEYVPIVGGDAYVWDEINHMWTDSTTDAHWRSGDMTLLDASVDSAQVLDAINVGANQAIATAWQVYQDTAHEIDTVAKATHDAAVATFKVAQDAYYVATHTADAAATATFNAAKDIYYLAKDEYNKASYAFYKVATDAHNAAEAIWGPINSAYWDTPNSLKIAYVSPIWWAYQAAIKAHDLADKAYVDALNAWNTVKKDFETGAQAIFNAAKVTYDLAEKAADALAAKVFSDAQGALALADATYEFVQQKIEQVALSIYQKAVAEVHDTLNKIARQVDFDANLKIDADIFAQLGLKVDAELDLGSVDTDLSYRLTSISQYNETTDQLLITPLMASLTDGTNIPFSTVSPNVKFRASIMYDVGADTTTTVSGQLTTNGVQIFEVEPVTVTKQITTNSVYQDALEATSLLLGALPAYGPLDATELAQAVADAKVEAQTQGFDPGELVLVDFDSTTDLGTYKLPLIESLTDGALTIKLGLPTVQTQGVADSYTPGDFAEGDFVSVDFSEITSMLLNTINARFDYSEDFLKKYPEVAPLLDAKTIADLVGSFNDGLMALLKDQLDGKSEAVPIFLIDRTDQTSTSLLHLNTWADPDPASISEETGKFGFYTAYGQSGTVVKATLDVDQVIAIIVNEIVKKVVLALTGVDLNVVNLPISNPYNIEVNLKQVLELAYVPKEVTEKIAKVVQLGYNFQQADLDVSAEANFSQEFALSVEDMAFVATLEDGAEFSFTANTAGSLKIDNASSHDANHDGQLSYTLDIAPSATFWNDTEVGLALSYQLDYIKASLNAGVTIPVGELLGINASWLNVKIPLADLNFGPLLRQTGDLDLLSADVFETNFNLKVGNDSVTGSVDTRNVPADSSKPVIVNLNGDRNSFVPGDEPAYIDPLGGKYAFVSDNQASLNGGVLSITQTAGTADGAFLLDARLYSTPLPSYTQIVLAGNSGGTILKIDGSMAVGDTLWLIGSADGLTNTQTALGTVIANGQAGSALTVNLAAGATVGDAAYNPGAVGTLLQVLQYTAPTVGARTFSATVSDGTNTSTAATFGMNGGDVLVTENHTLVADLATSLNLAGLTGTVSYAISGNAADNNKFSVDSATGALHFITAPDFEAPTDLGDTAGNNSYTVQVTATGATSGSVVKDLVVGVTDDGGLNGKILNLQGNHVAISLSSGAAKIDTGTPASTTLDPKHSFSGGYLLVKPIEGTADGSFSFSGSSSITSGVDKAIAAGESITIKGQARGTVSATDDGQGGHALRIDFNSTATASDLTALINSLQFLAPTIGERSFELTANDGATSLETLTLSADIYGPGISAVSLQEVRGNSYTLNDQTQPALATLTDGSYVVVWKSNVASGDAYGGLFAQRFNAIGEVIGNEFHVNFNSTQIESYPVITALKNGGFAIAWAGLGNASSISTTNIQVFNAEGVAQRASSAIYTNWWDDSYNTFVPTITTLSTGETVVNRLTYATVSGILTTFVNAYTFDVNGNQIGTMVSTQNASNARLFGDETGNQMVTTGLASGGYLVTAESRNGITSDWDIYARHYNADGTAVAPEFAVNTTTSNKQSHPVVTVLADNSVIVVWQSIGANGVDILAQRYNDNLVAQGPEFLVNGNVIGDQSFPAIVALSSGGFVVSWQSPGNDGLDIYAQIHSETGAIFVPEFLVNTTTNGDQTSPALTALADGGFVVAWQSGDGNGQGIYTQVYGADGQPASYTILTGSTGDDIFDVVGNGATQVKGRAGDDFYTVDASDLIIESPNEGNDTIESAAGYTLPANVENLILTGSANVDGFGNNLDNTLTGNTGSNTLFGRAGNDTYVVDGSDTVVENPNEGLDTIRSSASITLPANVENLVLTGSAPINATGNGQDNAITGNSDNNTLDGGAGNDTLTGGAGDDIFLFAASGNGIDTITDFNLGSILRVTGANFTTLPTAGTGTTVGQNLIQVTEANGVATLYIGTDATPGADVVVVLPGVTLGKLQANGTDITLNATGNRAPTLTAVDTNYTDSVNDDTFTPVSGSLPGADPDGNPLTYGIAGGEFGDDGRNVSKTGSYGTLTVDSVTGAYTFTPVDVAIENVKTSISETFTVTVTDGAQLAQTNFTINLTGANDTTVFTEVVSDTGRTASGWIGATDRETGDADIIAQTATPGSAGTFTINTEGTWFYSLTASEATLQALAAGESITDTFAVATAGGSSHNVVVTLGGANDAPTLDALAPLTLNDTNADDSFAVRTGTLGGHDADTTNTLTYGITGGTVSAGVASKAGLYGSLTVNTTSGEYAFTPNDAAIEARTTDTSETFTVTASDGTVAASTSYTVNLIGANDSPTLTTIANLTGATEGQPYTITYAALAAAANEADRDAGASLSFRVESVSSGSLTKSGSAVAPGVTTLSSGESLVWTAAVSEMGAFTVTAFDGALASSPATQVTIGVTSANHAPVLITSKSPMLFGVAENMGAPTNGSAAASTLVSELIDSNGALANFTDPDGNPAGIAITGVSTNGTLFFSTNGGATWAAVGLVSATSARVLHADALTRLYFQPDAGYSGTLGDALTFKAWDRAGTYTNGQDGVNTVTGNGNPVVAFSLLADTAGVTIADINQPPALAAIGGPVEFNLALSDSVDLFEAVRVATPEVGQTIVGLTLTVSNVSDLGQESLNMGGTDIVLQADENGTFGDTSYSVLLNGATATVSVDFGSGISAFDAQTLIDNISYSNRSLSPSTDNNRVVTITSLKDNGGTAFAGADTVVPGVSATVSVTGVNNLAPTLVILVTSLAHNQIAENTSTSSRVKVADIAISDDTLGVNTISLSGADAARFEVFDGDLYLRAGVALNFESQASYAVTVNAADSTVSGSTPVTANYTLALTDVNDAPLITSNSGAASATIRVPENSLVVTTLSATDADGNTMAYGLSGGEDRDLFSINTATGALSFLTSPDFEVPTDRDHHNNYRVDVTVSDGHGGSAVQALTINVTDLVEGLTPVPDADGVPDAVENAAPGLPRAGGVTLAGDGNGDGVADGLQADVTSLPFQVAGGSTQQVYLTLVVDSLNGKNDADANSAELRHVKQLDAPTNLPPEVKMPLGLISFESLVGLGSTPGVGVTETFSLYVEDRHDANGDPVVNGYWTQDSSGTWVNLASDAFGGAMVHEGGRLRLDFVITDGGEFDADHTVNGTIEDLGAAGFVPLSLMGYAPDLPAQGFWF